jgi:hypothetical protein
MVDIANIRTSRWQEPAPDLIRGRRREARSEVYLLARGLLAYGERANVGRGSSKLPFTRLGYPVFQYPGFRRPWATAMISSLSAVSRYIR